MLKKANRVTSALFKSLGSAKGAHTKNFSMKFFKNNNDNINKFAVVISKKISKSAVKRNRIKRRLRAVFVNGNFLNSFPNPFTIVIYVKNDIKELSTNQLLKEMNELFTKAKLL